MVFKTKMRKNAGSMLTVIPAGIVNLLNFEKGDTIEWTVDISDDGAKITIEKTEP